MDHQAASEQFSEYLDGDLSDTKRKELETHLGLCIQCRTDLAGMRRAMASLGKMKQGAPPDFLDGIKQQINRRSRGRFFGKRWLLFGRIPFEWVSLAMIIAMLAYYLAIMQSSPTAVTPTP